MSTHEKHAIEDFNAAIEVETEIDEAQATVQAEARSKQAPLDLTDLLSDTPPNDVLDRTAHIAIAPQARSPKLKLLSDKLGALLRALSQMDPDLRCKDGPAFMQGAAEENTKRYLKTVEVLAFDVDDGPKPDGGFQSLKAMGLGVVMYPSYNDEKRFERASKREVHKWIAEQPDQWAPIEEGESANDEQVLAYFRKGLPDDAAAGIHSPRFKKSPRGPGGWYFVGIPIKRKYRVVVFLSRTVNRDELGDSKRLQSNTLSSARRIVARLLGLQDDEACDDLSRIFYSHRRPKGVEKSWHLVNFEGRAIDADKLLQLAKADVAMRRKKSTSKSVIGGLKLTHVAARI